MSCWERMWSAEERARAEGRQRARRELQGEYRRIDREIEELRLAVYEDKKMSSDAMGLILGRQLVGDVQVRLAVDGHDIEVREENGVWRVINPNTLTLAPPSFVLRLANTSDKHIRALNTSILTHNIEQDVIAHILTTSHTDRHLLRNSVHKNA